jgi:hypothetical protein
VLTADHDNVLLQVIALLGVLTVTVNAVQVSGVEESYSHIAIAPIALSQAPELEISHAPVAIAHAPVVKEVEHDVSTTLLKMAALCKEWIEMESLVSSKLTFKFVKFILLFCYCVVF